MLAEEFLAAEAMIYVMFKFECSYCGHVFETSQPEPICKECQGEDMIELLQWDVEKTI